jgi:hypothetical protein
VRHLARPDCWQSPAILSILKDHAAKSFEQIRDAMSRHGAPLGFAIASLQIAIALASVALITKRKILWGASTILGTVGIAYLFYGLFGV